MSPCLRRRRVFEHVTGYSVRWDSIELRNKPCPLVSSKESGRVKRRQKRAQRMIHVQWRYHFTDTGSNVVYTDFFVSGHRIRTEVGTERPLDVVYSDNWSAYEYSVSTFIFGSRFLLSARTVYSTLAGYSGRLLFADDRLAPHSDSELDTRLHRLNSISRQETSVLRHYRIQRSRRNRLVDVPECRRNPLRDTVC